MTSAVFLAADVINACIAARVENNEWFTRELGNILNAEATKGRWSWRALGYSHECTWGVDKAMRKLENGDEFSEWHQLVLFFRWANVDIQRVKELAEIAAAGAIDGTITLSRDDMRVVENFIQLRS